MQIEKINENQIEVILDLEDLKQNNISIHSFMCNSSASQNLFSNILILANNEIGFNLENYEIIIEAFSVPNQNFFVLVITRVPQLMHLHLSTRMNKFKIYKSFWIKFSKFEDFCMFCNSLKINYKVQSSLYFFDNCYFLHMNFNHIKDYFKVLVLAKEFLIYIYNNRFFLDENAELIIGTSAIQTAKKYFV